MCEMLGISSAKPIVCNNLLNEFYSHSVDFPHGWGLAYTSGKDIIIEREALSAYKSTALRDRLQNRIVSGNVLAHIRYATIGNIEYENCHPFSMRDRSGRTWTLMHNGTIFNYEALKRYSKNQKGETDSERILMYLIDSVNDAIKNDAELSGAERFHIVDEMVRDMAKGNKLNLILFDGERIYVHVNFKNSLYFCRRDAAVFFSSAPLREGYWEPLPFARLLSYADGRIVQEGSAHNHEYLENKEDNEWLYRAFSGL